LRRAIGRANSVTPELVSELLDLMLAHCAAPNRAACEARVRRLITVQAWTEAALALIGLDHTRTLRRISFEDGEWRCVIGSKWPIPDWLDEPIESIHELLPLAILGALADAVHHGPARISCPWSVPASVSDENEAGGSFGAVSCDNFR
jgi:hypothetical protein